MARVGSEPGTYRHRHACRTTHDHRHLHRLRFPRPGPVRLERRPGVRPGRGAVRCRRDTEDLLPRNGDRRRCRPHRRGVLGARRPVPAEPSRAVHHAQRRRRARPPARPGRDLGRWRFGGQPAGALAAARLGRLPEAGLGGGSRARRGVRRLDLLAQRRHHRLVRADPAAGHQRTGLAAVLQRRPLRLGTAAPAAVPPADRGRHPHRRLCHRRRGGAGVPRDRDGRGGGRSPGLRGVPGATRGGRPGSRDGHRAPGCCAEPRGRGRADDAADYTPTRRRVRVAEGSRLESGQVSKASGVRIPPPPPALARRRSRRVGQLWCANQAQAFHASRRYKASPPTSTNPMPWYHRSAGVPNSADSSTERSVAAAVASNARKTSPPMPCRCRCG